MSSHDIDHGTPDAHPKWDVLVRLTHWGIACAVLLNAAITEEGSRIHVWVGYAVLGLLALRLVWGLVGTGPARFSSFPPSLSAARAHVSDLLHGRHRHHRSHNPLGTLMAYALWATLAVIVATGVGMAGSPLSPRMEPAGLVQQHEGSPAAWQDDEAEEHESEAGMVGEALEEVHEAAVTLLLILAALHVGGVALESLLSGRNLIKPMVKGS